MTSAGATVLAAVIGAVAVIISVVASLFVARASATAAVKTAQTSATAAVEAARASATAAVQAKLDELKQAQITSVIQQRIDRYPFLWKLCQESITLPAFWLNELSGIWSRGFEDDKGVSHTNLAASMKNDLGSYMQAALSL